MAQAMGLRMVQSPKLGDKIPTRNRKQSFGDFIISIVDQDSRRLESVYKSEWFSDSSPYVSKSAMGETGGGSIGGYLVPLDYSARLMKTFAENAFIYPRAMKIPMGSSQMQAPRIDVESVPSAAGISPMFGGLKFSWSVTQTTSLPETEPGFRSQELVAYDLLGIAVVSNQWLQDLSESLFSVDADSYWYNLCAKAAAWSVEYSFLNGTGTAQQMPLGVLQAPACLKVKRKTANEILVQDVAGMAAALMPGSWSTAIWLCSPTAIGQIAQIPSFTLNRPIWDESGTQNPCVGSLLTLPLYVTEKLPALGSVGDLMLIDPACYIVGDRQAIVIDVSEHPNFRTNQSVFRIWVRMGGCPLVSNIITLQDLATQVSPYIALQ